MALPARIDTDHAAASEAGREILLWTTRDGREIPLDEMSDEHVANAVRVLSLWRARLKKQGGAEDVVVDLKAAIERFKSLQRKRRKTAHHTSDEDNATPSRQRLAKPARSAKAETSGPYSSSPPSRPSRWARPRKPVAKT